MDVQQQKYSSGKRQRLRHRQHLRQHENTHSGKLQRGSIIRARINWKSWLTTFPLAPKLLS